MRNKIASVCILVVLVAGFGFMEAQTSSKKGAKAATKNDDEIIHDIQELEKSLRAAFVDGKSFWWERHLDEHYAGMNPDGQIVRKADLIQLYGSDVKYEEVNLSDMSARIYDDCVIASTRSTVQGSYKGQDFSGEY